MWDPRWVCTAPAKALMQILPESKRSNLPSLEAKAAASGFVMKKMGEVGGKGLMFAPV